MTDWRKTAAEEWWWETDLGDGKTAERLTAESRCAARTRTVNPAGGAAAEREKEELVRGVSSESLKWTYRYRAGFFVRANAYLRRGTHPCGRAEAVVRHSRTTTYHTLQ